MCRKGFIRQFIVVVLSIFAAATCQAGETWWQHDPTTPGDWFVPANWTDGVPTDDDYAYIDNAGTAGIGGLEAYAHRLYVGNNNTGALIQTGGHLRCDYSFIGYEFGSLGEVVVTGAGSTLTNSHWLGVGNYGAGTLEISNGGSVSSVWGRIGYEFGSEGTVTVSGVGSTLTTSRWMNVGYGGVGTLNIENGGTVLNTRGYVGWFSGSEGTVTVSGPGSTWTSTEYLRIGVEGAGRLNITNGGSVSNEWDGHIGGADGQGGAVTVSGLGSTWTNEQNLHVAYGGTLDISNGGLVSNGGAYIGVADSLGTVTVTGTGSTLTSSSLYVGESGTGRLEIADGGAVDNIDGYIGYRTGSTGVVTVDGSGSTWTNRSLYVGDYGQGTLNITNGGAVSNDRGYIGCSSGPTGVVTVDGSGSTWTNSSKLYVGRSGQGTLNITNGGAVNVTGDTWVARYGGAGEIHFDGGTLTTGSLFFAGPIQLTGTGTINTHGLVSDVDMLFDSAHGLNQTLTFNSQPGQNITINLTQDTMGHLGAGYAGESTLAIRDGVSVESFDGYIGYKAGATGEVTVAGSGSTWTNSSIFVGYYGQGTLNITNVGAISNTDGYIGRYSGSTGVVTVDGIGSTWTNSNNLRVGRSGQGTLNITNGGAVSNTDGHIGCSSSSTGVVTVDGSGSVWTNSGDLYVGGNQYDGQGTLNITNGGAVNVTGDTWVAKHDGAGGEIHFDGGTLTTGGLLTETSDLTGTGTINTHGLVSDVDLLFDSTHGLNKTLTFNSLPGQNITINLTQGSTGSLGAGYAGESTLAIRDGVSVESFDGYIGYKAGATGVATVDGSGSTWTNSGYLYVGDYGHGTLNITNGGAVSNSDGYIGYGDGSTSKVMVAGSGSAWTSSGNLTVGDYGQGTLNITNGGAVSNSGGSIGSYSGSTGVVTVDGSGSTWTNSGKLYVGLSGQGTLNITNGGAVSNDSTGHIGYGSDSTGVVTVDGSGSTWTNSSDLTIGDSGQGTLNITNGGAVNVAGDILVARNWRSAGEIHFDSGTLTTGGLFSRTSDLTGTGTINTHGLVSNMDLLFDSAHGPNQTITLNSQPDRNITINLTQDDTGALGAGYTGSGTLAIHDGVSVESSTGYIGYLSGSTGVVTVDGSGSTWTCCGYDSELYIGYDGRGTLNITNGGAVSNSDGYIGYDSSSTGVVTVDGSGSTWTNRYDLYVGGNRYSNRWTGELTVSNDGIVEVGGTLKVRDRGTLNMGATGTVTVGGTMILMQDSTLTADAGATIHMTGSAFENTSTNSVNLTGLGNLTLIFEGGSEDIDPFEVAGEDMGTFMAGYQSNFALGTLQLGGEAGIGQIRLVDTFDNQPDWAGSEALYVENLILGAGSTLDLNGLNLYYLNFTDLGGSIDLNGGSITQVPEPATLGILISGFIVGCLSRRRRN